MNRLIPMKNIVETYQVSLTYICTHTYIYDSYIFKSIVLLGTYWLESWREMGVEWGWDTLHKHGLLPTGRQNNTCSSLQVSLECVHQWMLLSTQCLEKHPIRGSPWRRFRSSVSKSELDLWTAKWLSGPSFSRSTTCNTWGLYEVLMIKVILKNKNIISKSTSIQRRLKKYFLPIALLFNRKTPKEAPLVSSRHKKNVCAP